GRPFHRQAAAEIHDAGAGRRGVGGLQGAAVDVDHDVDDAAGLALVAPVPGGGLHHVPGAVEVGVDHRPPAVGRVVHRVLGELATGVVHQHVQPALLGPDGFHQRG